MRETKTPKRRTRQSGSGAARESTQPPGLPVIPKRGPIRKRDLPPGLQKPADSLDTGWSLAKRFKAFGDLPFHPLFAMIHARLIQGQSPWRVAAWIMNTVPDDDVYSKFHIDQMTLFKRLKRYTALLPPTVMLPQTYLDSLVRKADVQVDALQELAMLITYQKIRIDRAEKMLRDTDGQQREETPGERDAMRRDLALLKDTIATLRDTQLALSGPDGYRNLYLGPVNNTAVQVNVSPAGHVVQPPPDTSGFVQDPLTALIEDNPASIPEFLRMFQQAAEGVKRLPSGVDSAVVVEHVPSDD